MRKFSAKIGVTALSVLAAFAISVPDLHGAVVNCNSPNQSLQGALDQASDGDTITVVGGSTCLENIVVKLDHVTLDGKGTATIDGSGDPASDAVRVLGTDVTITGFTITGGTNGITAIDGAVLRTEDVIVTGGYGVGSFLGAVVVLTGVDINNNGGHGVRINNQAMVDIREGSNISSNSGDGVSVNNGSLARIRGATVQNNAGHGVQAFGSRVTIQRRAGINPVLSGNTEMVVQIAEGSSCRISDATISYTGSTWRALKVSKGSGCTVQRSTLTSDNPTKATVLVKTGSGMQFLDGNVISNMGTGGTALSVGQGGSVELSSGAGGNTIVGDGFAVDVANGGNLEQGFGAHATINGDVNIFASSHVQFQDATINGNIEMSADAFLRLRNRTDSANTIVNGNVELFKDSLLEFKKSPSGTPVVVNGNVFCGDAESSFSSVGGDSDDVMGTNNCTGFD